MGGLLFVLFVIVGSITAILKRRAAKIHELLSNPQTQHRLLQTQEFLNKVENFKIGYFTYSKKEKLQSYYESLYTELSKPVYRRLNSEQITQFNKVYSDLDQLVVRWNEQFVKQELRNNASLFDDIDSKSLDEQQRRAVVVDEDNNLILAGAGSGKTLTISAKVKYLVEKKNVNPEEILLISFTRRAAEEMQDRITNKLGLNVEAKTFHKLGLDIISKEQGYRPDIFEKSSMFVNQYFKEEVISNKSLKEQVVRFIGYYLHIAKDLEEFLNLGEAHSHYKSADFETIKSKIAAKTDELKQDKTTIKGEVVRSLEEVIIANFLYLNGVKYTYEKLYPFESQDKFRKRYRPDFYLDDYDLYLEHFGITEDNRTPWLSEVEEKKYIDSMEWKRDFHRENETMLLETYSYYNKSGILLTKLDEILTSHGVVYKKVDYAEIYDELFSEREDKYFGEFKKLIQTFIELFKSRGYSEANFEVMREKAKRLNSNFEKNRTLLFLSIVRPIYASYQKMLRDDGYIDFNDMINLATDLVRNGKIDIKLKYIIIDEYQDISISRFNLIKEIKKVTNAKVVAVGDDWQSIFRFAGSDIALFTSFDKYLGYSAILRLEKTYRNCQELLNIAEKFVTRNPYQMKKHLSSDKHHSNPIRILGYGQNIGLAPQKAVDEIVHLFGENTEIMILGRHNFDIDVLKDYPGFTIRKTSNNTITIHYSKYKDLRLTYRTVHSSKGTEADNVIIINLENELLGFPNKISDDPLLSLVLTDLDSFDYAEEKRLFYVAITRTKNMTYLVVPDKNQSIFIKELIESFGIRYSIATGEVSIHENPRCSTCQEGYLVLRENITDGSKFLGCTNYPHCENTVRHIEILDTYIKCNSCGGYMVRRNGKHGEFYGCTNYPFCVNTINVERKTKYY